MTRRFLVGIRDVIHASRSFLTPELVTDAAVRKYWEQEVAMTESFDTGQPITIALPIADRRTTFDFYAEGLGLHPLGKPGEDGVPEPLQFALNDGLRVMFIPTGGFGWVTGNRVSAPSDQSECLLVMTLADQGHVQRFVDRARGAGAEVIMEPAEQPWGFTAVFADPDGHLWQVRSATSEGPFAEER